MTMTDNPDGAPEESRSDEDAPTTERKAPSITALISQLAENADAVLDASDDLIIQSKVHSLVGKTLDNKYEVLKRVGQGGMGVVYKARHTLLDRFIALKVLNPSLGADEQTLKRFLREAKLLSRLKHPNAISLYEFGIDGDIPYLVMEFVEGISLAELIHREGPLALHRAASLLTQASGAVESAHELGIIHRDLKPDNIMITKRPNGEEMVHVLDFGVAKLMSSAAPTTTKLTTGVPCGTPHYMSPELITGGEIDGRSDVYALGIILFEMLTGETPFEQDSIVQILFKQVHDDLPLITEYRPELKIPATIEDVICKAVEKDPAERYASVAEFAAALAAHVGDIPDSRKSNSRRKRMRKSSLLANFQKVRKKRVFNIEMRYWIRFWLFVALAVGVIWPAARWRRDLRVPLGAAILRAERSIGLELVPLRKLFSVTERLEPDELFVHASQWASHYSLDLVLKAGMDPNVRDSRRRTPLHHAVDKRIASSFEILMRYDTDASAQDNDGITPLHLAAQRNEGGMIYDLLRKGAQVDAQDNSGRTPLMHAILHDGTGAVHALVGSGASVQMADSDERTPLLLAIGRGNLSLVQFLLDRGAGVNVRDRSKSTPLMASTAAPDAAIAELLLKRGANVHAKNEAGFNALMLAVSLRQKAIVTVLLEAGADPRTENNEGVSALELAESMNAQNLVEELQRFAKQR